MATTYKILGRGSGGPVTPPVTYTVPAGKVAVISSISVANMSGNSHGFNLFLVPDATTSASTSNCIASSVTIAGGSRVALTEGMTLTAGYTLRASSQYGVTVIVFGSEIDA